MPRVKSNSGGLLLSHGSSSSRSSLALKLLLLGMGGCALLAAVYLPGRETVDARGSMGGSDMRGSMGDIHSFAAAPAEPAFPGASAAADAVLPPDSSTTTTTTTTTNSSRNSSTAATAPIPPAPPAVLLFPADAQLHDLAGALVNAYKALEEKSVGLYFGAGWCGMTKAANPGVSAWVKAREAEGVTLVYVSSDTDAAGLKQQQTSNGWPFAIPYDSPLRTSLKEKYKVWSMRENGDMEGERESGIPTVVVVGKDGEELAHLDVGVKGIKELDKWNFAAWKWT